MTAITERNQVIEMISRLPITTEITPGFFMMNIKRLADFLFGDAAALASEVISFADRLDLFVPVWTALVFIAAQPSGTVGARRIPRLSLPLKAALSVTKDMLFNLAGEAINCLAAIIARVFFSLNILNVIRPTNWMCLTIFLVALFGTKSKVKFFRPTLFSPCWFSTISASMFCFSGSGAISTLKRTVLLIVVIIGNYEVFTAIPAWLFNMLRTGFIGAGNRAKQYLSISPWLDRVSAIQTLIHSTIVP